MVKTLPRFAFGFPIKTLSAAAFAVVTLAACQASSQSSDVASASSSAPPASQSAEPQDEALTFAQAACGGCHSVEYPDASPNPNAPTFASIANREGLNEDTLASWLTDAHNYPEVMDFDLSAEQVEQIAGHMLTLQQDDYAPEI